MATLELQGLTKRFGEFTAVDSMNLKAAEGEMIALLGGSGCGKTTTLRMIAGFTEPTAGQILVDGKNVSTIPPYRRNIGIFFQNYALFPHMTVFENVAFGLKLQKLPKNEIRERVKHMLALVKLTGMDKRYPRQLSGGQQQRVALARALVTRPSILLLDEPLSNLDAKLRVEMQVEIKRIQKELGITTIIVTHDHEEAVSLADRVIVMNAGHILQIGKPQEVYDNPVNLFVAKFLGTPPIHVFDGCIRDGKLYIGGAAVLDAAGAEEQPVYAAVRPEGFVPAEDGPLCCKRDRVEVMGRDISVVCTHPDCENAVIRAIITAESRVDTAQDTVRFALKPHKVFLFHRDTQVRLDCTLR